MILERISHNKRKYGSFIYHGKSFTLLILAQRVTDLLKRIVDEKHQKISDIHLIGFSLGSHLMGTTRRMMKVAKKKLVVLQVKRLTAAYTSIQG